MNIYGVSHLSLYQFCGLLAMHFCNLFNDLIKWKRGAI